MCRDKGKKNRSEVGISHPYLYFFQVGTPHVACIYSIKIVKDSEFRSQADLSYTKSLPPIVVYICVKERIIGV